MSRRGKLTDWNDDRGFGFISPGDGSERVFAHISAFTDRHRRPAVNDLLRYELGTDQRGRTQARRISFADGGRASVRRVRGVHGAVWISGLFLCLIAAAVYTGAFPPGIIWLYTGASAVAFLTYWLDKSAAENNEWRISESTLHILALLGGWPGALIAQQLLRHKSRKTSFKAVFWVTVLINCCALAWFWTPSGAAALRSLLHIT